MFAPFSSGLWIAIALSVVYGALVLLLLAIAGLVLLSWQDEPDAAVYVALLAGSTLTIIALLREQTVVSGRLVLAGALGAHLVAMTGSPAFEDDWFRFLWDGWRTVEAGTPSSLQASSAVLRARTACDA